jgi:hypothetical protein
MTINIFVSIRLCDWLGLVYKIDEAVRMTPKNVRPPLATDGFSGEAPFSPVKTMS